MVRRGENIECWIVYAQRMIVKLIAITHDPTKKIADILKILPVCVLPLLDLLQF